MPRIPMNAKAKEMMELIREAVEAPYKSRDYTRVISHPLLRQALRYFPHICFNCHKAIPFFNPKIRHTNIAQNPPVKLFCSKECRDRWMALASRINNNPALIDLIVKKPNEMTEKWTKLKSNLT